MGRIRSRGRWTEAEAQALLEQWKRSSQTLTAFARRRGYVPERLRRWKKKLESESEGQFRFVPVEVAERPATAVLEPSAPDRRVEIAVGDTLRVVVAEPVDAGWVARLVVELRAAGC